MKRNRPLRRPAAKKTAADRDQALKDYSAAVDAVESTVTTGSAWTLAISRTQLAELLQEEKPMDPEVDLEPVAALDERAKTALGRMTGDSAKVFERLRDARDVDLKQWWWTPTVWVGTTNEPLWLLVTAACWGLALTLTSDTINRWLVGGPDWTSAIAILIQAFVALLGGAAFVEWGRRWLLSLAALTRQAIGRRHQLALATTIVVLATAIGVRASLPRIAEFYQVQGQAHFKQGRLASALESWRRASSLDPDSWSLRYQLGSVLERLADTDKAIAEYRLAAASPEAPASVHNNLARLYFAQKNDPTSALALLEPTLKAYGKEDETRYRLLVNRGASYLSLKLPALAKFDALAALQLAQKQHWASAPSASCLLALASSSVTSGDVTPWAPCLSSSDHDEVSDPRWLATAREQLLKAKP
ncbi:tetratricopeptide repeat protein [Niveibacterium microcysteis]|uniref:Tetratricopeptide repeat protein n=1 Tax=Niveibacterium microcysteis TaxID=2811415 RepID=A0ABX7M0Q3_9RHOO|nr:tetratricopeptide repeat protein [Niveibacterium microcysteis]QSI75352.1 tetratricopeptide repeat protein [Niveibacterium microcysteis]